MRFFCWLLFGMVAPPLFLLWLETIVNWQTARGLMGSLIIFCSLALVGAAMLGWQFPSARRRLSILGLTAFLTSSAFWVYLAATAPTNSGPGIQRHNPNPPRFHPLNLIPEVDQVAVGLALSRHMGVLPVQLQERLDQSVLKLYESSQIQHLGSSTVYTWSDIWGGDDGRGDCLYYVPEGAEDAPVLLFLHGALGNFHSHLVILLELCRKRGYVLLAPTFGAGQWNRPQALDAIEDSLEFAGRELPVDPQRVVLVSLSNGTEGALLAAREWPHKFRGLCSISGRLSGARPNVPLLLLHGEKDRLVPFQGAAVWARKQEVEIVTFPEHDHSLFYVGRTEVTNILGRWMEERVSEDVSLEN